MHQFIRSRYKHPQTHKAKPPADHAKISDESKEQTLKNTKETSDGFSQYILDGSISDSDAVPVR